MAFSFLSLENEESFVNKIESTISSMGVENKLHSVYSVESALEAAKQISIDVFIVNVNLEDRKKGINTAGIEFIKELREIDKATPIITTGRLADPVKTVAMFNDLKIFSYLEKDFENEHLKSELEKAVEYVESTLFRKRTIAFKRKGSIKVFPTKNIFCIQRVPHGKKQILVTSYDDIINEVVTETFSIKSSLGEILDQFENSKDVLRVHQSWIVNPKMIRGLDLAREEITLLSNIRVPIGDTYRRDLRPYFKNESL
ncbi:MAG: response regulator [Turicibacter sp.]|nr:response regulator [Turicibacter sp.]